MIRKMIIFLIILSIWGCGRKIIVTPNNLPDAHVSKEYHQVINISGGRVISQSFQVTTNFPNDMNISVQPVSENEVDAFNHLKIVGVPKYKGKYTINVYAIFYAGGGRELNKTYDFIVKD